MSTKPTFADSGKYFSSLWRKSAVHRHRTFHRTSHFHFRTVAANRHVRLYDGNYASYSFAQRIYVPDRKYVDAAADYFKRSAQQMVFHHRKSNHD